MKDNIVQKSLNAALYVIERLDDSEELRGFYSDTARYRTQDSFERN